MFKKSSIVKILAAGALLTLFACQNSLDNNKTLEYQELDISFQGTLSGATLSTDDVVGIFATCTRGDAENVQMAQSSPVCFCPTANTVAGSPFYLTKVAEKDNILAKAGDHNYKFYAFAPYDDSVKDVSKISVNVPVTVQFEPGMKAGGIYVAKAFPTTVIGAVPMDFKSIVCSINLRVPDAIVDEDGGTILRSLVIRPADASAFTGSLAYQATFNLNDDVLSIVPGTESKEITVDFGAAGVKLPGGYTDINLLMAPFTVPEGGFELVFRDVNGFENIIPFLAKNVGTEYASGSYISEMVSTSSDGVIPCSSPVEWPIGGPFGDDGKGIFWTVNQPLWPTEGPKLASEMSEHIWTCPSQTQATIKYVAAPDSERPNQLKHENNNFKQYNYSAPCVKGQWTGDYFYFDIPVKKFPANHKVKMTLPTYSRGAPLFWDIEYLDGDEWKCQRTSFTSPDGQFTKECTLMVEHGNKNGSFEGMQYVVELPYTNAIKSGHLYIKFKVADGSIITYNSATYAATCKKITAATTSGDMLFAFVNKSDKVKAVSVEW